MENLKGLLKITNSSGEPLLQTLGHDAIEFLIRTIIFIIILYLGSYFAKKVDKYIDKIPVVNQSADTKQFTKSVTKLGLNVMFFLIGLLAFGFSESSIATMISAIGLGVGISLKEFLSNLAGGMVLFFTRPFSIGNFIKINGVMGEVCKIEVFSTYITSLDGRRIIVPNNVMISGNIINYDADPFRRIKLMLSVSYDSDMKKVISILENIANTYEGLAKDKENFINTMEYGDSSINILFMVWTPTKGYYKVRGELMAYILEVFNKEGVNVPFNILDVNVTENK
ncbi:MULTISPECIES: mechanosensitive ion channel family protein [Cetobacterium]|uniref:Mechanosensitive ion channel n=1 Tax=Candidatus Cetobacterium colombiensis TaxID=3073100 RepID=A0ABU4W6V6_9FUSO|nr:mechanosensitive ion channel domain-containing protein [Candidatus Cetobacterium colombiensis]MDX8335249.1 mechanosensitive ion channel [Candidatus Cetobacterium colombiensis]